MMKSANLEEPSTQSSERNSRIDYSDTKSVASRTTFTLDEKESLRPDDSASMQAGADDDSPSESVLAGAKAPSNPDMRAFRDQLYEIDRTENSGMLMQRGPAQVCLLRSSASAGDVVDNKAQQPPPSTGPPPGLVIPPDEKLQEALASPKDRLFVLKVEQDLIDFITDSKCVVCFFLDGSFADTPTPERVSCSCRRPMHSTACFATSWPNITSSAMSLTSNYRPSESFGSPTAGCK